MIDHGSRKFYDTAMTNAGVHTLYIELLEGHSVNGVKNSYFKPTENDLLEGNERMRGYISAINELTRDESQRLQQELTERTHAFYSFGHGPIPSSHFPY